MNSAVTHVAGPHITISGRTIQRCIICGSKLADNLNCAAPLNPDGSVPGFPTWRVGGYVQSEGNRESDVGHWDTHELPTDLCLESLVE